jgi:hypothetical protein
VRAIKCAKVEAVGVDNGVGVVKLMGRNCGYITAHAALASRDVDVCLVPEVHLKRHLHCFLLHLSPCVHTRMHHRKCMYEMTHIFTRQVFPLEFNCMLIDHARQLFSPLCMYVISRSGNVHVYLCDLKIRECARVLV